MHRGSNALLHSSYGAFSGIAAFYLGPFRSGKAAWATWVGTIRTIGTSCPSYMRNYSQEVARAATQRIRDLDNKGNNHDGQQIEHARKQTVGFGQGRNPQALSFSW